MTRSRPAYSATSQGSTAPNAPAVRGTSGGRHARNATTRHTATPSTALTVRASLGVSLSLAVLLSVSLAVTNSPPTISHLTRGATWSLSATTPDTLASAAFTPVGSMTARATVSAVTVRAATQATHPLPAPSSGAAHKATTHAARATHTRPTTGTACVVGKPCNLTGLVWHKALGCTVAWRRLSGLPCPPGWPPIP